MSVRILLGDVRDKLAELPDESVHCVVTSPPYFGLRDYGIAGQIGLEPTPAEFVAVMVDVFREVRRVLRKDGTLWLNLGDSYAAPNGGFAPNAPSNLAGSKQASTHPHATKAIRDGIELFLLSKSARYHYDAEAIAEAADVIGGRICGPKNDASRNDGDTVGTVRGDGLTRNRRSVWTVATQPFKEAHFATFPPDLIEPCIKAGCPKGGTVLDPFGGAGTTGLVADRLQRDAILIELNPEYIALAGDRITDDAPLFAEVTQ